MNNHLTSLEFSHFPVMLNEIIKITSPSKGGTYIDCTFGGGGYSNEILRYSNTKVTGLDRDKKVKIVGKNLENKFPSRFKFYQIAFSDLDKVMEDNVDGVIFDLGLSSIQLNDLKRGFSFKSNENLDMAMGLNKISAQEVINNLSEIDLKKIIKFLGEEKEAAKIAKNIVKFRSKKKIVKVQDLVGIIKKSKKKNYLSKINPCTKTFQALRMFVNKEITELITGIIKASKVLKPGGKLLVVSFHSIEDKIVKYFFKNFSKNKSKKSRYFPDEDFSKIALFENYKNIFLKPSKKEIDQNNRSRSAKLRYAIRSDNKFNYPNEFLEKFKKYLDLEGINV